MSNFRIVDAAENDSVAVVRGRLLEKAREISRIGGIYTAVELGIPPTGNVDVDAAAARAIQAVRAGKRLDPKDVALLLDETDDWTDQVDAFYQTNEYALSF